jgi:cysteinyl-tRNA synthetase
MSLRVTNSLSGEREAFEPLDPESVLLYYCGLTVSDPPHLGHARSWVHVDVMHRWLEASGYDVRHVENVTDVNEKIVARIGEDGDSEPAVATHYLEEVIADMRGLNLRRAEVYPRVSEHVDAIVGMIERLLERGYAYESNGSVYFDVTAFEDYGKLSNQNLDSIESQGEAEEQAEKRHPADFALWKAGGVAPADIDEHRHEDAAPAADAAGGAQTWDSPWGEGRPGWHIECSAMSTTHLGETIDIHAGGQDLVFPHHENEIAQSECATGEPFVRYWLHVALLDTGEEKMSSSLQNYFTVETALAEFGPNPIRTFLLSAAYRSRQSYTEAALAEAVDRWETLKRAYDRAVDAADSPDAWTRIEDAALRDAVERAASDFRTAMDDDFNTRGALTALDDLASAVNRHVDGHEEYDYRGLREAIETFESLGGDVLGLQFDSVDGGEARLAEELVELVLDVREAEREAGNYERADGLRDDLEGLGVEVQDTDDGVTYRFE